MSAVGGHTAGEVKVSFVCKACGGQSWETEKFIKGRARKCRACDNATRAKIRAAKRAAGIPLPLGGYRTPEQQRAYRERAKLNPAIQAKKNATALARYHRVKNSADYQMKRKAVQAVRWEVAAGRLVRMPCEKCGAVQRVQAHHDDYSKPLDVRWLCPTHHAEVHGRPNKILVRLQQRALEGTAP